MNKILIIVPAYNEVNNILPIIQQLKQQKSAYIVINDGSTDNTSILCNENKITTIELPVNIGLSGAIRAGMRYADIHDYDYVVQIDGD